LVPARRAGRPIECQNKTGYHRDPATEKPRCGRQRGAGGAYRLPQPAWKLAGCSAACVPARPPSAKRRPAGRAFERPNSWVC